MWGSNILYFAESQIEAGKTNGGTTAGWYVAIGSKMMDTWINFFNVYDNCRFDYFMQSLGKSTTTVTGAAGFVTNAVGILLSGWANTSTTTTTRWASASSSRAWCSVEWWVRCSLSG